jgi:hypothetical protein
LLATEEITFLTKDYTPQEFSYGKFKRLRGSAALRRLNLPQKDA